MHCVHEQCIALPEGFFSRYNNLIFAGSECEKAYYNSALNFEEVFALIFVDLYFGLTIAELL